MWETVRQVAAAAPCGSSLFQVVLTLILIAAMLLRLIT